MYILIVKLSNLLPKCGSERNLRSGEFYKSVCFYNPESKPEDVAATLRISDLTHICANFLCV